MKSFLLCLFLAAVCFSTDSARAQIYTLNNRIDHSIYQGHEPEIILAGQIVSKKVVTRPPAPESYPAAIVLQFKVTSVIQGDAAYLGKTLSVSVTSFMWPVNLLPCDEGTNCVFLFSPVMLHQDTKDARYYIETVVPARDKTFPTAKDGGEAKKILEDEILAQLDTEKAPRRQQELLLQVAPILEAQQSFHVEPLVSSPDGWVRRAALAALIYATEKEEFLRLAAPDIQNFFATTKSTDLLRGSGPEGTENYAAYPFFFTYYFFLEKRSWTWGSRWDEAEATKNLRIVNALMNTGLISPEVKQQLMSPEKR